MKSTGNTILITGGTSGIGKALAIRFHQAGNQVIIAGRRQALIDAITAEHPGMVGYPLDVEDAADITAFAARVLAAHPDLNVLVNNAGIMKFENVTASRDVADAEAMVAINLLGPIRLTNALIDHLSTRPDAALVNVSSGLAFVPIAVAATYSATKAALHSYSVSLRTALAGKVEVIELAPPAVQTDLTPGQSTRDGYLPLKDFIDEVMALIGQEPTPPEILVTAVHFLRNAEKDGRFDETVATLDAATRRH